LNDFGSLWMLNWGSCIRAFVSFDYLAHLLISISASVRLFISAFYLLLPSIGLLIWKLNGFLVWSKAD